MGSRLSDAFVSGHEFDPNNTNNSASQVTTVTTNTSTTPTSTPLSKSTLTRTPTSTPIISSTFTRTPTSTPISPATSTRTSTATPISPATSTRTPTLASSDTITITRAEYTVLKHQLRIEATSTNASATLQAYVTSTGQFIGTLVNNGGGGYSLQISWPSNPQNITVRGSLGGS